MEKVSYVFQQSRIYTLGLTCTLFWICLFYFHSRGLQGTSLWSTNLQSSSASNQSSVTESKSVFNHNHNNNSNTESFESVESIELDESVESIEPVVFQSGIGNPRVKFPFMKAMRTVDNKSYPCGGRYVYVYDLPSRFNEDMMIECSSINRWFDMCKFVTNLGLGPPLNNTEGVFSDTGWYGTDQFTIDDIFFNRMKQYECLTNDSPIAIAVFVLFYAGFDGATYLITLLQHTV